MRKSDIMVEQKATISQVFHMQFVWKNGAFATNRFCGWRGMGQAFQVTRRLYASVPQCRKTWLPREIDKSGVSHTNFVRVDTRMYEYPQHQVLRRLGNGIQSLDYARECSSDIS